MTSTRGRNALLGAVNGLIGGLVFGWAFQVNDMMIIDSAGDPTIGQVFFVTDGDPLLDEAKSLVFEVTNDGEFYTYDLDMSSLSGWSGLIQQLRFGPVASAGCTIEIDRIAVGE